MSAESDLLDFIYPDYSKVLCDGIKDLYQSKAWTDMVMNVNGTVSLVHTFMLSLFAPELLMHCEDNKCDLQELDMDQHTVSTLLDFIYKGQVQVERQRLDSIRRGANLLGLKVLSKLISQETKQDSINTLSDNTETNSQEVPFINCEKPLRIGNDAILQCSRCELNVEITDVIIDRQLIYDFKDHLTNVHKVKFDRSAVKLSYKCKHCDFVGDDNKVMGKHRRSRHRKRKPKTYKCCNCDFVADKRLTVIRHKRSEHTTGKLLKCTECDFSTTDEKVLKVHQRFKHNIGEYECDVCGKRFTTPAGRKLHHKVFHTEPEERNSCSWCSYKTKVRADLKQHLLEKHNKHRTRIKRKAVYKDKKQCPRCEAVLNNQNFLIHHLAIKHRVDLDGNPVEAQHKCESCDFVAYSLIQLSQHNAEHHPKTEYKCDHCERKFRSRDLLADHIKWKHFGEKVYMCEVCGKSFGTRRCLAYHRKLHSRPDSTKSGKKELQCENCEKSFTRRSRLNQHLKRVHGKIVKRHQCEVCPYTARNKLNLAKHMKSVHKVSTCRVVVEKVDIREREIAIRQVENKNILIDHNYSL